MRGGVEADTVTSNKFIGDLEGNCSGIAGSVEWSNITNKPFTDGSQAELKDASDDVKEEYGYIEDNSASFVGVGNYNALGIQLSSSMSNSTNVGKIIYTTGGTYESFKTYTGNTIPAGSVPAGYYKLGIWYGSFLIGSISGTTVDFSKYYLGESYMVESPNTFNGTATAADSATTATKLSNTSSIGSSKKPVYFSADGVPVACSYTLGSACQKGYTDSSSASAISTSSNLVTERDVYYGLPRINNSKTYTSNTYIYAPTTGGTSGYVLKSNGSTSVPTWVDINTLVTNNVQPDWNQADSSANDYIKNRPVVTTIIDHEVIYSANMYSIEDSEHGISVEPENFYISSDIKYNASYIYEVILSSAGDSFVDLDFQPCVYGTYILTFSEGVDGMEATYESDDGILNLQIIFQYNYDEIDILPKMYKPYPNGSGNLINGLDGAQIHLEFIRKKTKSVISEEYLPDSVKLVPQVTSEDEGKILKVVNGVPTWVSP